MVSLQETHPTPLHYDLSDRFTQYHTRDDVEASPPLGTMEREEPSSAEQPKVVSVQERIRALNRSAGYEASKPSRPTPFPTKQHAASPWQVKAAPAPVVTSKPTRNSLAMLNSVQVQSGGIETQESVEQPQLEPFSKSHVISNIEETPNAEIEYDDNVGDDQIDVSFAKGDAFSTDDESQSSDIIVERADEFAKAEGNLHADRGYSNTLHQFMMDSAQVDDEHQIEEFDDDIEEDFGASAAVQYWRRSKGTANQEDESATNEDVDHRDDLQEAVERQDSEILSGTDSPCEDSHDFSLGQQLDSREAWSDTQNITHTRADEYIFESQPDKQSPSHSICEVEEAVVSLALGADNDPEGLTLLTDETRTTTSSHAQSQVSQPPSPPSALRTVQRHSYMDDLEETSGKTVSETGEVNKSEMSEQHGGQTSECESKEKSRRYSKPAPASSFSQRAFEKRSRIRASQSAQAVCPKAKETLKDTEITAEIDSASVFSSSTTHSSTTIHTTTLSSRATRLLRDRRKGIVKTDGLAKALAQKILRGNTPENTTKKSSLKSDHTCNEEENSKLHSESCATGGIEHKPLTVVNDYSQGKSENSEVIEEETNNTCREVGVIPMPSVFGDSHYSHTTNAPPIDYHFQRQTSHVSQHTDPLQFGSSQSCQNVEVGFSSGPSVYNMQHHIPHYINPVPATPFAAYPNADPRLFGPRRIAPINDLLVQPKFSRYNSFDVLNPKPPSIQNVLTEDSASWSESRTQDSAGGTQNTPQESIATESIGHESESVQPCSVESSSQFDSFPKGRSFDKGCTVFDHIQNACDALSPKSCNPEIASSSTIQSNELVHVGSTFSNTLSDEDVAIEVEYVEQSDEQNVDVNSIESDSIYSLSTRDMDSRDSFSLDNA